MERVGYLGLDFDSNGKGMYTNNVTLYVEWGRTQHDCHIWSILRDERRGVENHEK